MNRTIFYWLWWIGLFATCDLVYLFFADFRSPWFIAYGALAGFVSAFIAEKVTKYFYG